MTDKKKPIQYAIIRFAPFIETGEFANIGVVMFSPMTYEFRYRIERKKTKRVTDFFNDLNKNFLLKSMESLSIELSRISGMLNQERRSVSIRTSSMWNIDTTRHLFQEITREREGAIKFSEPRTVMSEDINEELDRLFAFYVHRDFVDNTYPEVVLEKTVRGWLNQTPGVPRFNKEQLGDELYKASFPFVAHGPRGPAGVIKPFFLGQSDPTKIIEHSMMWRNKVDRLEGFLPNKVLFTIEGPDEIKGHRREAFKEATNTLKSSGKIQLVSFEDKPAILRYAQSAA